MWFKFSRSHISAAVRTFGKTGCNNCAARNGPTQQEHGHGPERSGVNMPRPCGKTQEGHEGLMVEPGAGAESTDSSEHWFAHSHGSLSMNPRAESLTMAGRVRRSRLLM